MPPPPESTLFPYPTLFRSVALHRRVHELAHVDGRQQRQRYREEQRVERALERAVDERGEAELRHAQGHVLRAALRGTAGRSEEHTSELQSRSDLVCGLQLE